VVLAVALWFVISLFGLLLPIFIGIIVFFILSPIASGYIAGKSKKLGLIGIATFVTSVLAGLIGWTTIGSVPIEQQRDVLGIGWSAQTLILVWILLNAVLGFVTGYLKLRFRKEE